MGRLIDADALKEVFRGEEGAKALDHFPLRFIKVKQIIDNAPTIDAIPVEWLRELMLGTNDDVDKVEFAWIMRKWKEEQEAR